MNKLFLTLELIDETEEILNFSIKPEGEKSYYFEMNDVEIGRATGMQINNCILIDLTETNFENGDKKFILYKSTTDKVKEKLKEILESYFPNQDYIIYSDITPFQFIKFIEKMELNKDNYVSLFSAMKVSTLFNIEKIADKKMLEMTKNLRDDFDVLLKKSESSNVLVKISLLEKIIETL